MSIFNNPVIITLSVCDTLMCLQTYTPSHGWSQRFYLTKEALCSQLSDNDQGSITECDLLNVCNISRVNTGIRFRMLWLHGNYDNEVHGYQQSFTLPFEAVTSAISGHPVRYLSYTPTTMPKANIYLTSTAQTAIAKGNKLMRHAIRKFFRDNLNYGSAEKLVIQQDEFVRGFYVFSTVTRFDAGIVMHETEVKGKDGKPYPKVFYGLHT